MNTIFEKTNRERVSVFSLEEDGIMIYDQDTENTHLLNETAAYLYELLDKPLTLDEIVNSFKAKYTFDDNLLEELENDIIELLDEFLEKNLITIRRVDA